MPVMEKERTVLPRKAMSLAKAKPQRGAPVMGKKAITLPPEAMNLSEVEYPPELMARLDRICEIASMKIATGELVPQTVEELAAELGIDLDEEDDDD